MKTEGRIYGGGLHKIEPKELGRLSITELIENIPELEDVANRKKPATVEQMALFVG